MNPSAFQNTPQPQPPQARGPGTASVGTSGGINGMDVDFFQQPGTLGQVPTGSSTAAAGAFGLPQLPTLDANGDPEPERPKTKKELEQDSKDLELAHLLEMMDEYKPIIPDEVTDYYLQKSGFETDDVRVKRMLALAAQRFVSSISTDAFQYARARTNAGPGSRAKDSSAARQKARTRTVLTMEDLSAALKEYGVGAERAAYYL